MAESNKQEILPQYPVYYSADIHDELSLVDVWIVLRRYAARFWAAFVFLIAVAVLFGVFVKSEKYDVTTTMRIGSGMVGTGKTMIESSARLLATINEVIVPGLAEQMAQESPAQVFPVSQFSNPSSSDLIVISTHTRESQKKAVKSLHLQLAAVITSEHDDLLASMQRGSVLKLARENVILRGLENPLAYRLAFRTQQAKLEYATIGLKELQGLDDVKNIFEIDRHLILIREIEDEIAEMELSHEESLGLQREKVSALMLVLDGFTSTRVILGPIVSQQPVGMTKITFTVSAIILSFIGAFCVIVLSVFNDKVRERAAEIAGKRPL